MTTMNRRTHVVLADQLVKDIDTLVGSRQRSSFITQAAEKDARQARKISKGRRLLREKAQQVGVDRQ